MSKKIILKIVIACGLGVECVCSGYYAPWKPPTISERIIDTTLGIKDKISDTISDAASSVKTATSSVTRRVGVKDADEYYLPGSERQKIKIQDIDNPEDIKKEGFYKTPDGKIWSCETRYYFENEKYKNETNIYEILNIAYDPAKNTIFTQDINSKKMMPIYSSEKTGVPMSLIAKEGGKYYLLDLCISPYSKKPLIGTAYHLTESDLEKLQGMPETKTATETISLVYNDKYQYQCTATVHYNNLSRSYYLVLTQK